MQLQNLVFAATISLAAATGYAGRADMTKMCLTAMDTKLFKPVPTVSSTVTHTNTIRVTKYSQKSVTITPKPMTRTLTSTKVVTTDSTADKKIKTVVVIDFETSKTTLATTTFHSTSTATTYSTITTTYTAKPPSWFEPIQDTLEDSEWNDPSPIHARRDSISPGSGSLLAKRSQGCYGTGKKRYPKQVNCAITTFVPKTVITTKTKPCTTVTARIPVKTITKVSTIASTHIIVPTHATIETTLTTTSIIEETIAPSTTTTSTTTITDTVAVPGQTWYPACVSKNFANGKSSGGGFEVSSNFPDVYQLRMSQSDAMNRYACCTQCFSDENCVVGVFKDGTCSLYVGAEGSGCTKTTPCLGGIAYDASLSSPVDTLMNGPAFKWDHYLETRS